MCRLLNGYHDLGNTEVSDKGFKILLSGLTSDRWKQDLNTFQLTADFLTLI